MVYLKCTDVFVPGGFPLHTYNPRETHKLENQLQQVLENLCKLVAVTGHTKTGKTVLVRTVLPKEKALWIDGGTIGNEEEFWATIVNDLDLFPTESTGQSDGTSAGFSGSTEGELGVVVAKGKVGAEASHSTTRSNSLSLSRTVPSRVAAIRGLRKTHRPVVIDDFHYLPRELQGTLVRALKALIFDGLPVVIIAIPHRRYDAVKVEKEMTGRIFQVKIPSWSDDELRFIPKIGFDLLKYQISNNIFDLFAKESIGSPHLMQEFCRAICKVYGVNESFGNKIFELNENELKAVFEETAETIGRPIFEKLARGPRQRSDRIQRKLKTGELVDIYVLILHALSHLRSGLVTLEYEDLRAAIRDISDQDIPQLHEVARVLKHMSDIAATDQSSVPVIDFDEEEKRLHVTDPFFAFYLRWGSLNN